MVTPYPFLYIGEGCSYFENRFECCIWFKDKLSIDEQKSIRESIPFSEEIFHEYAKDSKKIFFYGEKDCEFRIKEALNADFKKLLESTKHAEVKIDIWKHEERFMPSSSEWKIFDERITSWLINIHRTFPIAFVFKPALIRKQKGESIHGSYGAWHTWSVTQLSHVVLPELKSFFQQPENNQTDGQLAERMQWLTSPIIEQILKTLPKKKPDRDMILNLLSLAEVCCKHDGITSPELYKQHESVLFQHGKTLGKLIETFGHQEKVEYITHLHPYVQLVIFGYAEQYPFMLLFSDPLQYLRDILKKIETERSQILSPHIQHVMMNIRMYWRDEEPGKENPGLLIGLAELIIDSPYFDMESYMRVEDIFCTYKEWEKVLRLYTDDRYLLRFSHPVEHLQNVFQKIPPDKRYLLKTYLPQISQHILHSKLTREEAGFPHERNKLAERILLL